MGSNKGGNRQALRQMGLLGAFALKRLVEWPIWIPVWGLDERQALGLLGSI